MKHQKKIIIGGAILVLLIVAAAYLKTYNDKKAVQGVASVGYANADGTSGTSTNGTIGTFGVMGVESKNAYSRIQSDWVWVKTMYSNKGYAPVVPSSGKDFVLTLNVDHTLSVTGDCNTIKGNYTIDKNTVSGLESEDEMSIGEMKVTAAAMTKKYCEGSKESAFLSDFSKTYAYDMRPLQLNLILPNNQGVMIFERKLSTQG